MWQSLRYIWPLFICQSLAFSSVTQMIFSASIVGKQIGPEQWATLPVALLPIGTAVGIMPVTKLMSLYGRRLVLLVSLSLMVLANLIAAWGIQISAFFALCFASALLGLALAAVSQLRFVAMELAPENLQAGAVSMVLFGGIIAALLGPEVGLAFSEMFSQRFVGSYAAMAVVALASIPFALVAPSKLVHQENGAHGRTIGQLIRQKSFLTAVSAGAVGYGIMSFIMTATPISMHDHFHHSLADTKWVIQSHIVSMFLPSLFSAWLVAKMGVRNMMLGGVGMFVLSLCVAFFDQALLGFWVALVLLGIGWNFLFVGGTVMLPTSHTEEERFTAQGLNDSVVFGVQAAVSLSSGLLLSLLGWQWMLLSCVPLLLWQLALLLSPEERAAQA